MMQDQALTETLEQLLFTLTKDQGAETDIGRQVFIGIQEPNDVDAPCVVLTPGQEIPAPNAALKGHVSIRYTITGYSLVNQSASKLAHVLISQMKSDIRGIAEDLCALKDVADSVVYQTGTPHYPESGADLVAVSLQYLYTTPRISRDLSV